MPNPVVTIQATFGESQSLDALTDLIKIREQYFKETAKQSVKAIAITVMKSIRAATNIGKLHQNEIELNSTNFKASTYREGDKKIPCLRFNGGARFYPTKGQQTIVWTDDCKGVKMYTLQVYWFDVKYSKKKRTYLIVAPSQSSAKKKAKAILLNRLNRYKGLAKRALTLLMVKAAIGDEQDGVGEFANQVAQENTFVQLFDNDKSFAIQLQDTLNYAQDAIKGGSNSIDLALQKALNAATATINKKFESSQNAFYTNKRLDIPFPEVRQGG